MLVIRPAELDDVDALFELASAAGGGLTTLPADREALQQRVGNSLQSFAADISTPGDEYYFLVMEDSATGTLVGTSAIIAAVGLTQPFYNYRLLKLTQVCDEPQMRVDAELLILSNDYAGASEMATLYLHPDYRGTMAGRLLSKCRYLLMAAYPERFSETVMAELRGSVDEDGTSPFWEAVARPFFHMDFVEADRINALGNQQFIADLMPKYPIYTNLLPQAARDAIGVPHRNSAAALKILQGEGFRYRGAVDIFDAGPCVEVQRDQIRTIQAARPVKLGGVAELEGVTDYIVANPVLGSFRAGVGPVELVGEEAWISTDCAEALGLSEGDEFMFAATGKAERRKT